MVREVVYHRNSMDLAADFHPPLPARDRAKPSPHSVPVGLSRSGCRMLLQYVPNVERGGEGSFDLPPFITGAKCQKGGSALAELNIASAPVRLSRWRQRFVAVSKRLNWRKGFGCQLTRDWRIPTCYQDSILRNEIDEARERELVRLFVAVDVGVIELDVVDDRRVRKVVPHLRTFVEVRRVVLVGLDHEILRIGKPVRRSEIFSDPADQEARLESRRLQHPGQ